MAAGGHFRWTKITFDRISQHFRSIRNIFLKNICSQIGHFGRRFWIKSFVIVFLAISDQYATFYFLNFFHKMAAGGHYGWPKITFEFFGNYVPEMSAGGDIGWTKITFDRISYHFRSIRNFFGGIFSPKSIGTSLYSRSVATSNMKLIGAFFIKLWSAQFSSYFHKMVAGGHFGFSIISKSIVFFHSR